MSTSDCVKQNEELIGILKQFPLLECSDDDELKNILKQGEIRNYKPGEVILDENSDDNWVYYLISGKARIIKHGKEFMVLRRIGDYIGKKGMVNGLIKAASVRAIDVTSLLTFDLSKVDGISETENIPLKYLLFRAFAETFAYQLRLASQALKEANLEIKRLKEELGQ
ncbi:cyclic nucleotide-binding domain-containing protein [Desulfococcaceae bacterium HSG7]|nr:cyclic nucleotide-binding domain-containing protein [Desulfococcaceae bacterium HSG7]